MLSLWKVCTYQAFLQDLNKDKNGKELPKGEYQSRFGSSLYLPTAARSDIIFSVNNVTKFSANPRKEHWTAVKRIFRYFKESIIYELLYSENARPILYYCVGFSDADCAGDLTGSQFLVIYFG